MTFSWGVVHTVSPLTVIEDGSSNALPVIQSLVDPSSLTVGDMVRVELAQGGRVVVYGLPDGDPRVGVNEGAIAALETLNVQMDTTNSTKKLFTQHGIGKIDGVTTARIGKTVTYPVPFKSGTIPFLQISFVGGRSHGAFNLVGLAYVSKTEIAVANEPTNAEFEASIFRNNTNDLGSGFDYYFSWTAVGEAT